MLYTVHWKVYLSYMQVQFVGLVPSILYMDLLWIVFCLCFGICNTWIVKTYRRGNEARRTVVTLAQPGVHGSYLEAVQ